MDANAPRGILRDYFDDLEDPRMDRTRFHNLQEILTLTLLAVTCGAEGHTQIEQFGHAKRDWLESFMDLSHGIPSHDTIGRVLGMLDPESFERCLIRWTTALAEASGGRLIALDGKTLRRSYQKAGGRSPIHMVNAFCRTNRMTLGQWATDEKSNEITAIPKLLELLDIAGAIVTVDALNSQKKIARQIIDQGGDYLMPIKSNHKTLHRKLKATLDEAILLDFEGMAHDQVQTTDGDHGRIEVRTLWCTGEIDWLAGRELWKGLASVAVLKSDRTDHRTGETTTEYRYYISSLRGDEAVTILDAARGHWGVENTLHWSLDVAYREDACRIRKDHGAENFSRIRRMTHNLLKQDKTFKGGIATKRLKCGWDNDYLLKIITQSKN